MNIGDKIKEQRLRKELTQEQLGELLNVSRSTVSSWEVGRNYPDLDTIISISDLFNISLDKLLREDKEMSKSVTKKVKMNKVYKIILAIIGLLVVIYIGFNLKLRMDEHRYRQNLENYGWEVERETEPGLGYKNAYQLSQNDVTFWTYVLPAGLIGFPLTEQNISVIANKNNYIVSVENEDDLEVSVLHGNDPAVDFDVSVKVNQAGQLIENRATWSKKKRQTIEDYLKKYQKTHVKLLEESLEKRNEIIGKK